MKGQTSTSALKRFMNKDNTVGHVFAFPFIFGFVCFSLIPVCISFYYAFTNYSLGSKTAAFIGFKNFLRLFQDEVFLKSLAITLKYVLISVPLKLTFALLVAYLLTRPSRMVTFYRSLYYLPSLVGGSVAVALVWKQLFARKGLFNSVLANMVNGFKGVLVQQMDPETGALLGERRKVYSGSGIGCTEGPRIYHIGSWYYLVVAEGGTGYSHCVTIARSDNVFGPYETMPDNPLLTSDQNDLTAIQKCGHGSFVETQNGEWYMAHLCSRPNSARGSLLGRETALQKITWQDGWPRLACGGKIAQNAVPAPKDLPEVELPAMAEQDDFDVPALAPGYATPRTPLGDCVNLTVRPGWLRLTGQESMNSLHHVTLVARRQQEHEMQAETRMDFAPVCPEQMAGFTYCYDSMNFYLLGKTCAEDGNPVLELLKSDTGVVEDVCDPVPVPDGTLDFKLTTTPDGGMAQFYYRQPQGEWQSIGPACPTDILTDEHCRGFTGAHVGVYAHDMAGLHNHADFDYLNVHFER